MAEPTWSKEGRVLQVSVNGDGDDQASAELLILFLWDGHNEPETLRLGAGAAPDYVAAACTLATAAYVSGIPVSLSAAVLPDGSAELKSISLKSK